MGDIRASGLMAAVEFVADRGTRERFPAGTNPHKVVAAKAMEEGVISRWLPFLPVTSFSPPLTVSEAEIAEAVDRYARGLEAAMPDLQAMLA